MQLTGLNTSVYTGLNSQKLKWMDANKSTCGANNIGAKTDLAALVFILSVFIYGPTV